MKIIGIDPGTARMGYSIVSSHKNGIFKIIEADVFVTPAGMDMHKRLKLLYTGLHSVLNKHKPQIMVVERLFFNSNAKTAITVGQARGIAMLAAADWDMAVFEYTALEAKRVMTGYGRADKKQMQEAVKKMLSLEKVVKSDDANDAVAIAICHIKKSIGAKATANAQVPPA